MGGVARGLVMCDGFAAIRSLIGGPRRHCRRPRPWRFSRLRRGGRGHTPAPRDAGRWCRRSARPGSPRPGGGGRRAAAQPLGRAVPRTGGTRWVAAAVARDPVGAAPAGRSRPGARRPLRSGFSGEQYALPTAVDSWPACAACPAPRSASWSMHRPAQPGRPDRARQTVPAGADQPGGITSTAYPGGRRQRRLPCTCYPGTCY